MRLKAIKDHRYAGTNYLSGDVYEATKSDSDVLLCAKLSVKVPEDVITREIESPKTKEMIPAAKKKEKNKKLKYKRRYII